MAIGSFFIFQKRMHYFKLYNQNQEKATFSQSNKLITEFLSALHYVLSRSRKNFFFLLFHRFCTELLLYSAILEHALAKTELDTLNKELLQSL